ncbi:hypothetical protein [Streptomyces sp. NPDC059861]|uniref:hypothetical protein n=1 Tax=Streptomyces sp. NPDC059861 TaxID=3346974 RepID=UPI00365C741D
MTALIDARAGFHQAPSDAQRWVAGISPTAALQELTQTSDATAETVGGLGPWPSLLLVTACTGALLLLAARNAAQARDMTAAHVNTLGRKEMSPCRGAPHAYACSSPS